MKKLLVLSLSVIALAIVGTGCLKDKDFEDQKYGTQVQDARAVSFPQSRTNSSVTIGILATIDPQEVQGPWISLEAPGAQSADTHITIDVDDALVGTIEAPVGPLTVLPASMYTFERNRNITAGTTLDSIKISFSSTVALDPTIKYGIGLRISSADNGFDIASNMKEIVVAITVKNPYDAEYTSNGYFYHPSAPRAIIDRPKELLTASATAVELELGDLGGAGYFAIFDVDPTTNNVTVSAAPGAAGAPYTQFDSGLPSVNPGYTPQWPGSAECNNTYDPATQTFKMRYGYMGGTGFRVSEEFIVRNP